MPLENLHVNWDATRESIRAAEGFRTEIKGVMTSFLISQLRPLQAEEAKDSEEANTITIVTR